jgi:hypothetical protein
MQPVAVESHRIRLSELVFTLVPFSLLLAAALLLPEVVVPEGGTPAALNFLDDILGVNDPGAHPVPIGAPDLALSRAILSIWLASLLLIPAICLYVLPGGSAAQRRYARLFWTFSYLAYMVHFWFAAFVIFGGVAGTFEHMRRPIAATNFFLTGWWTLDVLVAWLAPPERTWVRVERAAAHAFVFLVFVVTELFLRPTAVRYVAIALLTSVAICLAIRLSRPAERVVAGGFKTV